MDATHGQAEFGAPYVALRYTCRCGRSATQHGRRLRLLPRGWLAATGREGEVQHVCPKCRPALRSSTTA